MISIYTDNQHKNNIESLIKKIDRLDELINLEIENNTKSAQLHTIHCSDNSLKIEFDWLNNRPPLSIPKVEFSENNFYALVFFSLGNTQKAFEYLEENTTLYQIILASVHLQMNWEISDDLYDSIKQNSIYNALVLNYFGQINNRLSLANIISSLHEIILNNQVESLYAYSLLINIYLDNQEFVKAEKEINTVLSQKNLSEIQIKSFENQWITSQISQLHYPINPEILENILNKQNQCIEFFIAQKMPIQAGLQLMSQTEILNLKEDYIQAKEVINRAIMIFKNEEIEELMGEASVRKAVLLYNWSKNGQPQYYKSAINAYQDALKVFKREEYPEKFAEIKHNLALIYTEIISSAEESMIWSAFSASCFKEALEIYQPEQYPYEYAMAAHNYATALMNYPEAKLHQNLEKSQYYYSEALKIRTPENFPTERALTLLNQIELLWRIHNDNEENENKNLSLMEQNIAEIEYLTTDFAILEKLEPHKIEITKLKTLL